METTKETEVRFTELADDILRRAEHLAETATERVSSNTIRLGVTGLSRAGKTVFITSLVSNLLNTGRMPQLISATEGRILAAYLEPRPAVSVPRFRYEDHLATLTGDHPDWPEGTRRISELRLSLKVQPRGLLSGLSAPRTVHIDIIDYPGEWLLDLSLLSTSYAEWSSDVIAGLSRTQPGREFERILNGLLPDDPCPTEDRLSEIATAFQHHLQALQAAGIADCGPGRLLLPGDLEGSPMLSFAPLPEVANAPRSSLYREFERRYEGYKKKVVQPFFRDHFSRIDRQIVLIDVLGALGQGPAALDDLRQTMGKVLTAFRPGRAGRLARLIGISRVEKILFAVTKADHLHHSQHPALTSLGEALLEDARSRARFAGADTASVSIAALRTTVEDTVNDASGQPVPVVKGRLTSGGKQVAFHAGDLPVNPQVLLSEASRRADSWTGYTFTTAQFAPAPLTRTANGGPPHIRLDKACEFLLGDRL
jgi:predicted YcjX-like family ATPase